MHYMRLEGGGAKIQNINKPPCHLEMYHSRALHTKSGEDPTKTEGGIGFFCDSAKFPQNAEKIGQKIKK